MSNADEWQIDTPIEDLLIDIEWDAMVEESRRRGGES